jgi:hypothetical protein
MRQEAAERRGLHPFGLGNATTHIRGCKAEAAVAQYLGIDVPEDWTLEGDRARRHDVGGYHVRSSYHGSAFVMRDHDYTVGNWIFCATIHSPVILLTGWLAGEEWKQYTEPGYIGGKKCSYISAAKLRQIPIREACAQEAA